MRGVAREQHRGIFRRKSLRDFRGWPHFVHISAAVGLLAAFFFSIRGDDAIIIAGQG